jgi:hypothetical protein
VKSPHRLIDSGQRDRFETLHRFRFRDHVWATASNYSDRSASCAITASRERITIPAPGDTTVQ